MSTSAGSALPPEVVALLDAIAAALPHGGAVLRRQAAAARAGAASSTMIDVEQDTGPDVLDYPDGPLPVVGTVLDDTGGLAGEVLVWVEDGRLSGLEQSWYTDDAPGSWPDLAHVRVE